MTRTIYLSGKPHAVNIQRKYKTVWIAAGEFLGQRIEVTGKSETKVVAAWQEAALSDLRRRHGIRGGVRITRSAAD